MSGPTEHQILRAIEAYGGSFMQAIAEAYKLGDSTNRAKIRSAWAGEWRKYSAMAATSEEEE
jgi:hypothetical protein